MKRTILAGVASVFLLALIPAGGCGSSDDQGMTGAEYANQFCALLEPCCVAANMPVTMQSCHMMFGFLPPADSAAAQECLDVYRAMSQEATWCQSYALAEEPEPCKRAFPDSNDDGEPQHGSALPGQACDFDTDCAESTTGLVSCWDHVCRLYRRTPAGQSCQGSNEGSATVIYGTVSDTEIPICYRDEGLFCDGGTCTAIAQQGGSCTSDTGCADGTYCGTGVCKKKLPAGQSCEQSSSACDDASYCELPANMCRDRKPIGEACGDNQECETAYCSSGEICGQLGAELSLMFICP